MINPSPAHHFLAQDFKYTISLINTYLTYAFLHCRVIEKMLRWEPTPAGFPFFITPTISLFSCSERALRLQLTCVCM